MPLAWTASPSITFDASGGPSTPRFSTPACSTPPTPGWPDLRPPPPDVLHKISWKGSGQTHVSQFQRGTVRGGSSSIFFFSQPKTLSLNRLPFLGVAQNSSHPKPAKNALKLVSGPAFSSPAHHQGGGCGPSPSTRSRKPTLRREGHAESISHADSKCMIVTTPLNYRNWHGFMDLFKNRRRKCGLGFWWMGGWVDLPGEGAVHGWFFEEEKVSRWVWAWGEVLIS